MPDVATHVPSVTAHFADAQQVVGDLLIGADGVHSVVRKQLHGAVLARYAGFAALNEPAQLPVSGENSKMYLATHFRDWYASIPALIVATDAADGPSYSA